MCTINWRGVIFEFENNNSQNCKNVVYKITTDKQEYYIGSTTKTLLERCDTHCIGKKNENCNLHKSICKKCKVEILYQLNTPNKKLLKTLEDIAIFKALSSELEKQNINYPNNIDILLYRNHSKILNKKFNNKPIDLCYILNNINEYDLGNYAKIAY